MQAKKILKWVLVFISFAGITLFFNSHFFRSLIMLDQNSCAILASLDKIRNSQDLVESKPAEFINSIEPVRSGFPVRLKIPKINLDAVFEYVGLTPDGAMDTPKNPVKAAWYNIGPRPGEKGSAVVAGHYGIKDGKSSVFDDLYKLRKGDKIYIEDEKGVMIVFAVRESRRYDPNADAADVFDSKDGKSHLNLITCEGNWNKVLKSYSTRLVVFSDKE